MWYPGGLTDAMIACALRFDGYAYAAAVGGVSEHEPGAVLARLAKQVVDKQELHADDLDNFGAAFWLQRFLCKWGGEYLPTTDRHHVAWRLTFLHLYRQETPQRYLHPECDAKWRRYAADREQYAAICRATLCEQIQRGRAEDPEAPEPWCDPVYFTSASKDQAPTDRDALCELVRGGATPEYLFFWRNKPTGPEVGPECLSQWYPSPFTVNGVRYPTAEHYMMAEKARLFGDESACDRILAATTPTEVKRLGREVQRFDEHAWSRSRFDIVVRASVAKFSQNAALARFLSSTGSRILVEASPHDAVWGIGLAEHHPDASNPLAWPGLNLLGFALMVARRRPTGL